MRYALLVSNAGFEAGSGRPGIGWEGGRVCQRQNVF